MYAFVNLNLDIVIVKALNTLILEVVIRVLVVANLLLHTTVMMISNFFDLRVGDHARL